MNVIRKGLVIKRINCSSEDDENNNTNKSIDGHGNDDTDKKEYYNLVEALGINNVIIIQ